MKYITVGNCCEILDSQRKPITAKDREKGNIPYYGANGIQDYVNDYIFDDELVLVAEDGGNFGSKTKPIAYRVSGKCWVNNHAHVLKPKEEINVDYLCYSLMFYNTVGLVNGATRQKLTQASLRNMEIPKLPMNDQIKIVNRLQIILNIRSMRKKQLEMLDNLVKARFVEMFGDIKRNPLQWEIDHLKSHINQLSGYPFKSDGYSNEGVSICGGLIIMPEGIEWKSAKHWPTIHGYEDYLLEENDIVLALDRPWISSGLKIGRIHERDLPALLIQRTARIRAIDLNQTFLFYLLKSQAFADHCQITGSLVPHISSKDVDSFSIILPPIDLQNEFADFVAQIDKSKVAIQAALDKTQLLFDSLMQEYFG